MKKIININLSGRVIPIEDTAYEKLQAYIESLRRYFAKEESKDEIINDIESRIAELLHDKVRKGASSITDADIEEIAASMGRPEDLEAEEADLSAKASQQQQHQSQSQQQNYSYSEKKAKRRLYRDSSDKFIGGVCSGIAAYLNIDPTIVRILFAIITFGGFGLGFLAYIILWIVLPPSDIESYSGKRLFRNPDDKVIGGVAGGLAAYFDKSASTIRLIFAAPLLLSILFSILNNFRWDNDFDVFLNVGTGSLTGTFILAYVILWMVLPEAHSPYEKMEMRGEKVDVNTIRQNVKEGADNIKQRMQSWGEEVKESAQNFSNKAKEFSNTRGKEFARDFKETARRTGGGLGHAIGVAFKAFFLFIFGSIALAMFIGLLTLLFGGIAWWPINNFLWTSNWQQIYAWCTLVFFILVPLIGFIIWVIRRITRVRSRSNYLGWTFGFLWTIGWVSATLLGVSISKDFRDEEFVETTVTMNQPPQNKLLVAVSEPELEYSGRFGWVDDEFEGWDLSDDTVRLSTVRFNIQASKDSQYHTIIRKHGYGKNEQEATNRASHIQYAVVSKDSVLDLSSGYAISKEDKFRFQWVEIEIQVPIGKKIRFDQSVNDKLNPVKFKRRYRRNRGNDFEIDREYWRQFRPNVDYVMGVDGYLSDPEGKKIENEQKAAEQRQPAATDNDYRYSDEENDKREDSINLENELNEQKRIKKESEERIKELQEKQKKSTSFSKPESLDEEEGSVSVTRSSFNASNASLIDWF